MGGKAWARVAATVLLVLGMPPIAMWLGAPRLLPPWYSVFTDWGTGLGLAIGIAVVASIVWRSEPRALPWATIERIAPLLAFLLPALASVFVFERRPLLIDEVIQVWQANAYASLHLSEPLPPHPEFWETLHIVEHAGRRFGQFPAGWPAFLALGVRAHLEWLMAPIFAGLGALAWRTALRRFESDLATRALALLLLACAPFAVFMAGSHMNHGPTLACVLFGLAGLSMLVTSPVGTPPLGAPIACGLGFGLAITMRPLDGAAWGAPAAIWILVLAAQRRVSVRDMLVAGVAGAIPVVLLLLANAETTGSPLLFGYQMLWGHTHDLGFHPSPWGPPHTPARGLALLSAYVVRLQDALFESPVPAMLPIVAALWLARGVSVIDRYLMAATGLVALGYFAYWHDGNFLGPRFVITMIPFAVLWTARLPALVASRFGMGSKPWRATVAAAAFAAVFAIAVNVPIRARTYRNGFVSMRWDLPGMARSSNVVNALVFVRESWGAQLLARLWGQGASRPEAERLYRSIDACALEESLTQLENSPRPDAIAYLRTLSADSSKLRGSPASLDTTERYLPGRRYGPTCLARIREDSAGYLNLLAFLNVRDGNIYVRDLHGRDSLLTKLYPDRTPVVARRSASGTDGMLKFEPMPH